MGGAGRVVAGRAILVTSALDQHRPAPSNLPDGALSLSPALPLIQGSTEDDAPRHVQSLAWAAPVQPACQTCRAALVDPGRPERVCMRAGAIDCKVAQDVCARQYLLGGPGPDTSSTRRRGPRTLRLQHGAGHSLAGWLARCVARPFALHSLAQYGYAFLPRSIGSR